MSLERSKDRGREAREGGVVVSGRQSVLRWRSVQYRSDDSWCIGTGRREIRSIDFAVLRVLARKCKVSSRTYSPSHLE